MASDSVSMVLIVDADAASLALLTQAAELEGLRPIVMSSAADAGILARRFNDVVLLVLDISGSTADPLAARRLRLDAAHARNIPTVVVSDRPLTDRERDTLKPAATAVKPLHLAAARAVMRARSIADVMK